jgi:CRISPR-associated protein Csb2
VGDLLAAAWTRGAKADIAKYRDKKDIRPTNLEGDSVHYLVPIAANDVEFAEHKNTIFAAARSITHLGWGIDMVAADASVLSEVEVTALPGERWLPAETPASVRLRVPIKGTLDDLMRKHSDFLHRIVFHDRGKKFSPNHVPPLTAFHIVGYRRATDPPPRRFAAFHLRHPTEDRSAVFAIIRANCVAAMIRHAIAEVAGNQGRPNEWIDRYAHGHRHDESPLPRFSYIPLPSIERRRDRSTVLGSIRRTLVAELIDSAETHLPWARQMLPGQFLTDEHKGERRAMLAPLNASDWVLQRYTGESATWATVTPVILPGSDDGKFSKAEKLFFKALRHAGYSCNALAELEFRNGSFWPGGDLALRFRRPDYLEKNYWSVYHVRLRWREPIKGPLALGAGRHCGLGIFAATTERESNDDQDARPARR